MSLSLKAILLAADGHGSKKVLGENKCFLKIQKIPSFVWVLIALSKVRLIDEIWIVGQEHQIKKTLSKHIKNLPEFKKIFIVPQALSILDNLKKVLEAIQTNYLSEEPVLIVSGDIPLITPFEITEFILKHENENSDYSIGVISKEKMQLLLKERGKSISKLLFFPVKENCYRINNLHMVKPSKIKNLDLIEKLYLLRHNRRLSNVVLIIAELISKGYFKSFYFYICIQFSMLCKLLGFLWLHECMKGFISIKQIEKALGTILGAKVLAVETSYFGAALDIDSEEDYLAVKNFNPGKTLDQ